MLAVAGVAAVAGGGAAIAVELNRSPSASQVRAAGQKELAERWRLMDAGEIFPARIESTEKTGGVATRVAVRVGIAPAASCAEGFDRKLANVLVAHGCRTVLRATYVDAGGTLATTLGIAVMPDTGRASAAEGDFGTRLGGDAVRERYGVRALAFAGTVVRDFDDSGRQDFWFGSNGTPYLFFRSSGWTTGRGGRVRPILADTFAFADTALNRVTQGFAVTDEPCDRKGVRC
ncbi:hypothetical protein [Actinomadura fibrosa]|uniref:Uncharacterized protein n=1 Tax=Actinomadura fibrosa TaxID=111802 RepID=A0ABW2Y2G7_9ACTN|nr:hypothetical protein [Actinomadura fibrosa]